MNMTPNIGSTDKIARLAIGAVLMLLALFGMIGWWGWIGVVLVATALMNWCPGYSLLGVKTSTTDNPPSASS
jgi:hypothetical protein